MKGERIGRGAWMPVLIAATIIAGHVCGSPCRAAAFAPDDSTHVGVEKNSPITGGMRYFFNIYSAEHGYITEQLDRFDLKKADVQFGLNLAFYLTGWDYYLELEFGFDFGHPQYKLFEGETHNVTVQSANLALWFRRGFNDVFDRLWSGKPNIDFLPGVSIAYVMDANVLMQEDGRDDYDQILAGDGWGYAVGAALRWSWAFVEYRYRWRSVDAQPDGGGDFYFPGDAEIDFSGHFLGVGFAIDGNMSKD